MGVKKPHSGHTLRDIGRDLDKVNTGSGLSPAQELMRQDFAARAEARHQEILAQGTRTHAEVEAMMRAAQGEPVRVSGAIDELIGNALVAQDSEAKEVQATAWEIINEAGTGLTLNMKQWAIVQRMIELGIIAGRAGS